VALTATTSVSPPQDKLKEGFIMAKPQTPKPVFTRLTPEMSRDEQVRNLKAALIKSGFKFKEDKPHTDTKD
jgi:hypothetical protein